MRRKPLAVTLGAVHHQDGSSCMPSASHPVTLSPEQIDRLAAKLATLRHNVNNQLSLIVTATELMRRRPESAARFIELLSHPPGRITDELRQFSEEFERVLAITES